MANITKYSDYFDKKVTNAGQTYTIRSRFKVYSYVTESPTTGTIRGTVYLCTRLVTSSSSSTSFTPKVEALDVGVSVDNTSVMSSKTATTYARPGNEYETTVGSFSKAITKGHSSQHITIEVSGTISQGGSTKSLTIDSSQTIPGLETWLVTYNVNGGGTKPDSQKKYYGESLTLRSAITDRTGYTFTKWNTAADGSGTSYDAGASYKVNDDLSLYAQWTAQTSSVTLNMNGGSGGTASVTATYDSAMPSITKPTLSGWTFQGYYDTSATSGGTQYYTANGVSARTWDKTGAQTLYARWSRSITFKHGKNSASSSSVTQYKGGNVTAPSITAISGWTSLGWRTDTNASTATYAVASFTPSATTLYAVYSRTLTLSYTNGGGSGTAPSNTTATQYYNSGNTISTASFTLQANTFTAPTDVGGGWAFSKWGAGNANATWSWQPGVDAGASTSTAAVWTRTITFKSGVNGATSKQATQTRGSGVSVPSGTVTPSGWTFLGWRTDAVASTASYTGSTFSPSATTLYAVFSRTLTLSYTNGGGTGTAPSNTTAKQYYNSYGNKSTASFILRANTFTRAGYYFSKWAAGNANTTWSWSPAVNAAVSTSTAAQWVAYKITLTYNVNGGEIKNSPYKYNDTTYFKVNNNLVVSSTTSNGTYTNVTAVINTATTYANLWNVGSFNVTKTGYHIDGADAYICGSVLVNQDDSETNTTNKVTVARLNGGTALTADVSKTLNINWKANTYTVTLNKNNGSGGTDSVTATYDSAMPAATMPTRTGYTFNGYWDTNATSGGNQYYTETGASKQAWNKTANTTLYARWTEKTATLTYNNSGLSGSTVPSAVTMKYTTATTLSAATPPSNYYFSGWATSEARAKAGTKFYNGTQQYKAANVVPSAATLYAIWYGTVTYNANGHGTAPSATIMYYTPQPNAAAAISATGYTFGGWNTKADGSGTSYTAGSSVLKNANEYKANYTLYAKWTANTYTITFNKNGGTGGTATATATYDSAMPAITKPTRAGYKFEGYYDAESGGTQYYTAAGASARTWNKTSNTTLYAHWSATGSFVSGDYRFTVLSTGKVRVEAADKTKTTYAAIPTTVSDPENSGGILKVTSIEGCFNGCNNLTGDIFVSHSSGELESYGNVFSTTKSVFILATDSSVDHSVWQSVANQKSNVTYLSTDNDYSYIVNTSNHKYSIKVLNTTKTSYSNPKSTLSSAATWTADSMAGCFQGCNKLTASPTIPNTITNMSNCFSNCAALVNAPTIPNTVTNMNSCFDGCTSLQHITNIPANVATMTNCFNNCTNLRGNIVVNNKNVTSSGIFTNAGSTQNQIYIINGLGSDSTLATTWRAIANTNSNVHYEIDNLELPATFTVKRQIYTDNTTESINGYPGAYINSSFSLLLANIKYMPVGWTISWNSTNPVEKMGTTSIGNTITTQTDSSNSKLYFNNITRFLTNNNSNINVTNYYTINAGNKTLTTNRVYNATLSNTSANRNVIDAFYKNSDYIYTIIDNSSNPKKVAAYAFNRNKTGYSNIPSTITVSGTNYTVTSLYYPSYNTSGALDTNNYAGGCFEGCSAMTSAPNNGIPSTITDVRNCFKNCSSLHGNIIVNGNPSNYSNLFTGAGTAVAQDIYIINSGKQEIPTFWRSIANGYTKVHFEGDDNPEPLISSIYINRGFYVSQYNTWEEDDTGNWIKLNIYYTLQTSKLPVGWTNQLVKEYYLIFDDEIWDGRPIYMAEETQIAYVQPQSKTLKNTTDYYTKSGNTYTLVTNPTQAGLNNNTYWIKGYKNNIVFYFQAANRSGEEINYQTNVKLTLTDYLDHEGEKTEIVYAMFAMLDFLPGGHGMAIGQASFREGLEINLPTLIGEELIPPYRTNAFIPTQDHLVVSGKTYYNSAGTAISNPQPDSVEEYYEKVSVVDLNQRQLILGKYNVPDHTEATNQNYKFAYLIIGNGTDDAHRSNLLRVDEDGVTINGLQVNTINGITIDSSFTANKLVYAKAANKLSSIPNVAYFTGNTTASTPATYYRLHLHGATYGNTAANMISNTAGLFSFGDGGPQITFDTSATPGNGQAGALIYTDNDTAATGASWHFVSNQTDWNVTSKRFHARTGISIGSNLPVTSHALYVTGHGAFTGSFYTGAKRAYNDGNTGWYIGADGTAWCDHKDTAGAGIGVMNAAVQYSRLYISTVGTTSATGATFLMLGNATATGTANNSQGYLRLYGPNTGYSNLTYANSTSNVTNTLPATTGTLINTAGGQQINDITTFYREGTTANNYPAGLKFKVKDTTTGQTYDSGYLYAYQDHGATTYGVNFVLNGGGGLFIGSGESPGAHYSAKGASYTGEDTFITADGIVYIQANGNTIANRLGFYIDTSQQVIPCKADTATNNIGSIGTNSYKWANLYVTNINGVAVGSSPSFINTWRGIQNNLTSDSTTDSLSAAQGKALANGSARDSTKLPLAGGTMTGDLLFSNSDTTTRQIRGIAGANDYWRVAGGATASNAGWMEIATADDGNEPIYVRQYTGAYTTIKRTLTLLDADGNSSFPGTAKIEKIDSLNSNYKTINCDVSQAEVKAQNSSLTTSSADTDWFQALVKAICVKYPNISNTVFKGVVAPNSNKFYEVFIYNTSTVDSTTKLPQHSFGRALNYGGGFTKFGTDSYVWRFSNVDTNTWRPVGSGASDAAAGNHTHTLSIAADSGTNALTLAASTKYKLTAGGSTYIFTTPPNTITTATTTGTGNAVTAISASNGALTVTKGSTFLTSHQTVTNKGATLAWGSAVTVATIGSTNINVSLPANPNSDTKVTQTATDTNAAYEVLFSGTADNTSRAETARKTSTLTYNPSTKVLNNGGPYHAGGYKLFTTGEASADNVSIDSGGVKAQAITITAKTGYTPIGVIGWYIDTASSSGANFTRVFLYRAQVTSTTQITVHMRNTASSAAKVKVTCNVLYISSTQGT